MRSLPPRDLFLGDFAAWTHLICRGVHRLGTTPAPSIPATFATMATLAPTIAALGRIGTLVTSLLALLRIFLGALRLLSLPRLLVRLRLPFATLAVPTMLAMAPTAVLRTAVLLLAAFLRRVTLLRGSGILPASCDCSHKLL